MPPRATTVLALAAFAPPALAQTPTLVITADRATAVVGDSITWTVSISGGLLGDSPLPPGSNYLAAYDLSFVASDSDLALASTFDSAFFPITANSSGVPSGASLVGVSDVQSSILGSLTMFGAATLGSFTTQALEPGELTYDLSDGGTHSADHIRVGNSSAFTWLFEGSPELHSDTVTITPAPSSAISLCLFGGLVARRRR